MHKKSQSISINTIIIAAIALAVLIVLFVIFTGRFKIFSEGVGETSSCANSCKSLSMSSSTAINRDSCSGTYMPGKYGDVSEGSVCCCIGLR